MERPDSNTAIALTSEFGRGLLNDVGAVLGNENFSTVRNLEHREKDPDRGRDHPAARRPLFDANEVPAIQHHFAPETSDHLETAIVQENDQDDNPVFTTLVMKGAVHEGTQLNNCVSTPLNTAVTTSAAAEFSCKSLEPFKSTPRAKPFHGQHHTHWAG